MTRLQYQVIDSNMLRSALLDEYLKAKATNLAVLPEFAAIEAYKASSAQGIIQSIAILSKYPAQVVILRGTGNICGLRGTESGVRARMIDKEQTAKFARFCSYTHRATQGDVRVLSAIAQHAEAARARIKEIADAAPMLVESRKMLSGAYSSAEIKLIRTEQPCSDALWERFIAHVCLLSAMLFRDHPLVRKVPPFDSAKNRFIFRLALCVHLWTIEWIAAGSSEKISHSTIRNDMVDLHFATYATYYHGLMSADQKALRIYSAARQMMAVILKA